MARVDWESIAIAAAILGIAYALSIAMQLGYDSTLAALAFAAIGALATYAAQKGKLKRVKAYLKDAAAVQLVVRKHLPEDKKAIVDKALENLVKAGVLDPEDAEYIKQELGLE